MSIVVGVGFVTCRRKKKEREALGINWKRRIKGMLFFDWHFPISNNKLKLQASTHKPLMLLAS